MLSERELATDMGKGSVHVYGASHLRKRATSRHKRYREARILPTWDSFCAGSSRKKWERQEEVRRVHTTP